MTAGLLGREISEQPTTSPSVVNKLVAAAFPKGLDHIRRLARGDTESADLAAALAAREPRQDDPFDRLPTPEQLQARQAAHEDALAARTTARETVARVGRLPPRHAAALLRMSADQRGTVTPTLAGLGGAASGKRVAVPPGSS